MKRREGFLTAFLIAAFLAILILVLSVSGKLKFLSFLEKGTAQIQGITFSIFSNLPFFAVDTRIKKLEEDNLRLLSRISDFEKLKRENQALSDQFQTSYPSSYQLLEVQIIGAPSFVPGVSAPNIFILNKGSKSNIKVGNAVVLGNNFLGIVIKISDNLAKINTVNNSSSSFTVKTESGAVGIVRGGGNLALSNVLLSENLRKGELVLTKGDIGQDGVGIPPDLVVGKITEIEKNPSDLFQTAEIKSFVDFTKLSAVFVYLGVK